MVQESLFGIWDYLIIFALVMRMLAVILPFLLSCFLGDGYAGVVRQSSVHTAIIAGTAGCDPSEGIPDFCRAAFLSGQTVFSTGENSCVCTVIRSSSSGRRTQASHKNPFLIVRKGKVIDRTNLYVFLSEFLRFPSGVHTMDRYIHLICQLLI